MLIRSQDKKSIVNLNNIRTVRAEKQKPKDRTMILEKYQTIIVAYASSSAVDLGAYESEEKAIKVLDMIQNEFQSELRKHRVFQMPQDCEV